MLARAGLDLAADRTLGHCTAEKSSAGAVAPLATLKEIEQDGLCARAQRLGTLLRTRLETLRSRHLLFAAVRDFGLMLRVELRRADGAPAARRPIGPSRPP